MLEQLMGLFGMGGGAAAPAQPQFSPEIQEILAAAGYAPEDPAQAKRRAIAAGLASFGKNLANSTEDFLPALAGAAGTGAETYHKAREGQEDDRRKAALDLVKQAFGYDKAQDLNAYRAGSLDERIRANQIREGQTGQRIEISLGGLEERGRHNRVTEGQGQSRINETERYHIVQDENADDKTAIQERRIEDAYGTNQERLRQGRERIKLQQDQGKRDAARLKAQTEGGYYKKGDKGTKGVDSAKARNQELETRAKILRVLKEKAHYLGIDDDGMEFREPEAWKAGKLEFEEYAKSLYAEFGYDERGMPLPDSAQPIPEPNETKAPATEPQTSQVQSDQAAPAPLTGMGSRTDPVTGFTSQQQFDALPSGAWFINPADGKAYRKK